ncbi:lipopolysaccharide transport periplasmic protein LptA [Campylobacter mucosalis]|uniref:lipopolysaccharide transport periplasmic protein LptA n=1 Tax=Campylobacter mucosalis TaxID=202 RepID=UPI0014707DF8
MGRARQIVLFLALSVLAFGVEQVQIVADSFFADENKQISEFNGNVKINKGNFDELVAKNVVVHFDKNRQPTKYIATGDAKFKVLIKQKHYNGNAEVLIYEPATQTYTLTKDAHLHEIDTDKHIYGEKIVINQLSGTYNVNSDEKKPVKFIFQVEDKK